MMTFKCIPFIKKKKKENHKSYDVLDHDDNDDYIVFDFLPYTYQIVDIPTIYSIGKEIKNLIFPVPKKKVI